MNAQTPHSQLTFQLPTMSYIDAKWEEPNLRDLSTPVRRSGGLTGFLTGKLTAFRIWAQDRRALAELRGMTDRELLDIGLNRADLDRVFDPALNADLRGRGLGA